MQELLRLKPRRSMIKVVEKNAMYKSPKIQNQIIDICGDIINENIVHKLNKAKCFAVLVDETTDIRTVEQFSLCVRWLHLTGQGIAETIIAPLKHHSIHDDYLIGRGYNGASSDAIG
ncbi:hypothetical protein PR048_017453 [Dryococelus australis]|uniref:DUF4371 domain-containing protein n=1 Tax=Dryococelus australis TaxID=614101 RepID=A0ABQ9H9J7_9NEOP|nr:hypothetical protein PR048_017453 [Dryococelus australis]